MALLVSAADILDAIRSETARLSGPLGEKSIRSRLTAIRSLHSRDGSIIATTGTSSPDVRDKAETDWKTATEDWERALQELQGDLARTQSLELAFGQLWGLTRLFGAAGFRSGVDVLVALLETTEAAGQPVADWSALTAFDGGDRDDVVPQTLSRSSLFGGTPALGNPTSIGRSIRSMRGEATSDGLPSKANLEQELSAVGGDPEAIRQLEALYRESAERIVRIRSIATRMGAVDIDIALEGSRRLLTQAAEIIRELAPDQFVDVSGGPAPAAGGPGAAPHGAAGGNPDLAGAEDRYLAVRERKIKELESLGAWFRRFEPHNPVGHVIPELVRRSGLDLPRLLSDLFAAAQVESSAGTRMFTILGTAQPEAPTGNLT